MSFQKGKHYTCIDDVGAPLTAGKVYECLGADPFGLSMDVKDDQGIVRNCRVSRFDPKSVVMIAPSPVAAHAAAQQAASIGALYAPKPPAKPGSAPVCSCGQTSEKKVFATFEYFFCNKCKKEVGGKAEAKEKKGSGPLNFEAIPIYTFPPRSTRSVPVCPPGIVALKGEVVTCANCGAEHGALFYDLPDPNSMSRLNQCGYVTWTAFTNVNDNCCDSEAVERGGMFSVPGLHIKGRGWV